MSPETIAVLGATGAVGRAATTELAFAGAALRLGGREADRLSVIAAELPDGTRAETMTVDLEHAMSLRRFVDGCAVVLNCAGPSATVGSRVGRSAMSAGAGYVDAAGQPSLAGELEDCAGVALIEAGMMPGLSGLLPRWLAEQTDGEPLRLTGFVGGLDRFTPAAAADYVCSLSDGSGEALAAWRGGAVVSRAAKPRSDVELAYFPGRVDAHPFLSAEAVRLARVLVLADLEWYGVFDGRHTLAALRGLQDPEARDVGAAAARLVEAADLDLFGRSPYQIMSFALECRGDGEAVRTLMLRARDGYALSGAFAALAAGSALDGAVPDGVHAAADVLEPAATVAALRDSDAVEAFELSATGATAVEEGVL